MCFFAQTAFIFCPETSVLSALCQPAECLQNFPSEHCGVCVFTRLLRILHDCKLSSLFSLMLAFSFHPGLPSRKAFVWILSPVTLQPGSLYPHLVSSSFSYGPSDRLNYQHSQYGPPQSLTLFSCCLFWPQTQFSARLCSGLCSGSDVLL